MKKQLFILLLLSVCMNTFSAGKSKMRIKDAYLDREVDELTILWNETVKKSSKKCIGVEITYTNLRNKKSSLFLKGERTTIISRDVNVLARPAYLAKNNIDTIYSKPIKIKAREVSLSEKWKSFVLPEKVSVIADDSVCNDMSVQRYAMVLRNDGEDNSVKIELVRKSEDINVLQGDFHSFYDRIILRVVNVLYTPQDDILNIKDVVNKIGAMTKEKDGFPGSIPAYLSLNGHKAVMKLNIPYLENWYRRSNFKSLKREQEGIFLHELTHGYQHYPDFKNTLDVDNYYVALEGVADAVRFTAKGFGDKERIEAGLQGAVSEKKWLTPYRISACFIMWLRNYDGDFIRKFHSTIGKLDNWSFDGAIKKVLGNQYNVKDLWNLYIADVKDEAMEKGYSK